MRFRSAPIGAQARVLHGLQSFGVGLLQGVTGRAFQGLQPSFDLVSATSSHKCPVWDRTDAGLQPAQRTEAPSHLRMNASTKDAGFSPPASSARPACDAAGVVRAPVAGWRGGGVAGAGRGACLGAAGLLLKPTSGGLEMTSKCFSGCATRKSPLIPQLRSTCCAGSACTSYRPP